VNSAEQGDIGEGKENGGFSGKGEVKVKTTA